MSNKGSHTGYLVILGIDSDDKPHAARFNKSEASLVCKAAELMGTRVGRAGNSAALKLVHKLPRGKIFGSGKALVPLVKPDLYENLLNCLSFDVPRPDHAAPADPSAPDPEPTQRSNAMSREPWQAIGVGSVVLAFASDKDGEGWWEAVVIAVSKDGGTLSLRWRDWPAVKKFSRPRYKVGLLAPAS